jgi:putative DNA primase/helicase
VVGITATGWKVLDKLPVVFINGKDYGPQVEPLPGGKVNDLARLVNVAEADLPLLVAWLLDTFKGQKPFTFLSVHGSQGTGKSWTRNVIKSLVDSSLKINGLSLPETSRDLAILAKNRYLVDFDNVSRIKADISDALCRLATGNGFAVRKLYTDDDEAIFGGANPVCFNGIPDFVDRPDLQGRIIALNLCRMEDKDRKDEATLGLEFTRLRPYLLGALFDLVVNGLRNLPHVRPDGGPRMMDTYLWLTACEQGTGLNMAENYRRHVDDVLEEELEERR